MKKALLWLFWFRLPLYKVSLVTVISEKTKQDLLSLVKLPAKKIRVIPNGISSIFTYSPSDFRTDNPRILVIGTKQNKNLPRLFTALESLKCELTIIGGLSDRQKVLVEKLGINLRNRMNLNHQGIFEEYKRSDLVVLISTREGFGMPIVEAQAVGRPVICSDIEPLITVSGDAAFRADPYDTTSIRERLLEVISNPQRRQQMVDKGRINAERFSAQRVASKYYELYAELFEPEL